MTATLFSLANASMFGCACGHVGLEGLPGSLAAAGLAWFCALRQGGKRLLLRAGFAAAAVVTGLVFCKNMVDVLWFGHEPVFARIDEALIVGSSRVLIGSAAVALAFAVMTLPRRMKEEKAKEMKGSQEPIS
ncbi:MAG: hypothetical protein NTW19_12120 [Planctomycetota bacterium]|nr:hypothetical protein [Planctomycetota bacterium]